MTSLNTSDLVVAKIFTNADQSVWIERSARILRAMGDSVAIQVNGLDTQDPYWGMRLVVPANQCRKAQ